MEKVSGNRKELKSETIVTLRRNLKTKITVKELYVVFQLLVLYFIAGYNEWIVSEMR